MAAVDDVFVISLLSVKIIRQGSIRRGEKLIDPLSAKGADKLNRSEAVFFQPALKLAQQVVLYNIKRLQTVV